MQSVPKKIVIVTGAGYTVLPGARNRVLGEEAAAVLEPDGGDVRYLPIDLEDSASIARAAEVIDAGFGHLDILVNNAGIAVQGDGMPSNSCPDAIDRAFRVNFIGSVAVTQAMLPLRRGLTWPRNFWATPHRKRLSIC